MIRRAGSLRTQRFHRRFVMSRRLGGARERCVATGPAPASSASRAARRPRRETGPAPRGRTVRSAHPGSVRRPGSYVRGDRRRSTKGSREGRRTVCQAGKRPREAAARRVAPGPTFLPVGRFPPFTSLPASQRFRGDDLLDDSPVRVSAALVQDRMRQSRIVPAERACSLVRAEASGALHRPVRTWRKDTRNVGADRAEDRDLLRARATSSSGQKRAR